MSAERLVLGSADAYAAFSTNRQKGAGAMEDFTQEEQVLIIGGIVIAGLGTLLHVFGLMPEMLGQMFCLALAAILITVTVSLLSR